jgi:hypothetical protein
MKLEEKVDFQGRSWKPVSQDGASLPTQICFATKHLSGSLEHIATDADTEIQNQHQ